MAVIYIDIETGRKYRISGAYVHSHINGKWVRSEYLRPADMPHYPFIGVKTNFEDY